MENILREETIIKGLCFHQPSPDVGFRLTQDEYVCTV